MSTGGRTPGAYVLIFRLADDLEVEVGRLGRLRFPAGRYAYVGSAMGGLEARVGRHLRGGNKKHWHIDHLICHAAEREAFLFPSKEDIECSLAATISDMDGSGRGPDGFGSSDCRCPTHLFKLDDRALMQLESIAEGWRGSRVPLHPAREDPSSR